MMKREETRVRNPFQDPLVTELIEDPERYRQLFSPSVLVGETLGVFRPQNVVLIGPQGAGKSMILNLIRYKVLSEWISGSRNPPPPLKHLPPFLGISINLVRANFHAFGRRSVARLMKGSGQKDEDLDATCAADFLNHHLFHEFLKGIEFLMSQEGMYLRDWLGVKTSIRDTDNLARIMGAWDSWSGYYSGCDSLSELMDRCRFRLQIWINFLNANIDKIPDEVWESKSTLGGPLHEAGNLLTSITAKNTRIPLFVVIDQYEVLPELNLSHGASLQRVINSLIKARDPVVFYKIGARTYDWGNELRIWGAESRIEVQRDYVVINLADVLMRDENPKKWLFPDFAKDVALKRIKVEGHFRKVKIDDIEKMFGKWSADLEAQRYTATEKSRKRVFSAILKRIPERIKGALGAMYDPNSSPLEPCLAVAWILEQQQRKISEAEILKKMEERPWAKPSSWRKERIGVALLQIASLANQKKYYFGWNTIIYLSGANISAFLLLCGEIWDMSTKMGANPLAHYPIDHHLQTEGVFIASKKWLERDRNEYIGGRRRYDVLSRLGPAIHDALIGDRAISNPGHSGFSLQESDLWDNEEGEAVAKFLQSAVSWAIFEERFHTSKLRGGGTRRKWYLHPLLSPSFAIPQIRVKEPLYTRLSDVNKWLFSRDNIRFGEKKGQIRLSKKGDGSSQQLTLPFEGLK